jgi:hypothetical protein
MQASLVTAYFPPIDGVFSSKLARELAFSER